MRAIVTGFTSAVPFLIRLKDRSGTPDSLDSSDRFMLGRLSFARSCVVFMAGILPRLAS
jgi:hypothetical protein